MPKFPVFSVRDKLVGFGFPYVDQSEPAALRGFSYSVNRPEGLKNFAPDDYDLYKVGVFDTDTGTIVPEVPTLIINGLGVKGVDMDA